MLDENISRFLEDAGPVFYVTPGANRAVGLEGVLPDYHVICSGYYTNAGLLEAAGAKYFHLKKDFRNAGKILSDSEALEYIKSHSQGKTANILTFKPSPTIEHICRKYGFRYLGNDWRINREWEDKIKFARKAAALGLRNARSRVVKIEEGNLAGIVQAQDFSAGRALVVQFSRGYSGNSTFVVRSAEELADLLAPNAGRQVKIADFVEGDTYTFDACIGSYGVRISPPIFQITGFMELNRNPMGTAGNDFAFGKKFPPAASEEMRTAIRKVAGELGKAGYRGILGFDFVSGEDGAHIIEVNPRLVGSIPVFTKLQLSAGEFPFLLLHILSFLGFDFTKMKIAESCQGYAFSQLIFRNVADKPRKIEKALPGGIYRMEEGGMKFARAAYFADHLAPGEFFLDCAPQGAVIDPDMEYANIQADYGIMEGRNEFRENFLKIEENIFSSLILK